MINSDNLDSASGPMRLLNFGCGATYHPHWTNLDTSPASPEVTAHDLRREFPFHDATFDAAYGSHVLEHLEPAIAKSVLQDCFRILRPGGIIRIAVPDLETIARLYLSSLEGALNGDFESEMHYDWLMLELYDQVVREVTGGNMAACLTAESDGKMASFIAERIGCREIRAAASPSAGISISYRILRRLRSIVGLMRTMAASASTMVFLGPRGAAALRYGLFQASGEVHKWMYDRFSIARVLQQVGFASIQRRIAGESNIPRFASFRLEVIDGRERKPDSLYMEACKPFVGSSGRQ